jgi:hypothetical protein
MATNSHVEDAVFLAKLAEQAERYEGEIKFLLQVLTLLTNVRNGG